MNAEPPGFDRAALYAALREWELSITSLSYLPLGAGSHHYLARDAAGTRWFVTVDVLEWKLYGMFGPTFDPWVTPDLESGLDGASHSMTDLDRPRLLEAVGRLHACTDVVPADLPRRDSLTVPIRSQFFESLDVLHSGWDHGPFGESARRLLRDSESLLRDLWHRCDQLADEVRGSGVEWVITHGQLHSANVLRATSGVPILIDWDCVALAPRERDLGRHWGGLAEPKTREDWASYTSAGVGAGVNPLAVDLYWHIGLLRGLCVSTGTLQSPHVDDPDTRHMWTMLQSLLSEAGEASRGRRR